jgi:sulfur relay (sulfurtransferase) DsrC/TusE family protein
MKRGDYMNNLKTEKCKRNEHDKDKMIADLIGYYNKYYSTTNKAHNKQSPTKKDMNKQKEIYSSKVYMRVFKTKSWNDVLKIAGLPLNLDKKKATKDELIDIIMKYYEENGVSPTCLYIDSNKEIPSTQMFYNAFGTFSWNEILKELGLPLTHVSYDKEYALEQLRELSRKIGRIPKGIDLKKNNWKPAVDFYTDNFKSYTNALYLAGLTEKPLSKKEKVDISIENIRKMAKKLGRCPSTQEFELNNKNGLARRTLENRFGLSYNKICEKYIPEYGLNRKIDYTVDDMRRSFECVYKILGRAPKYLELRKHGFGYDFGLILRTFEMDSYNRVIESMGWIPVGTTTKSKSEEVMLEEFYDLFKKLGRVPYAKELGEETSTGMTYAKHFGTLEDVCNILGIDFNKFYIPSPNTYQVKDMNGELCNSNTEAQITNFLINNNIKYIKEYEYKNIVGEVGGKRRLDWRIEHNNKVAYVEYAGMYEHSYEKIRLDYQRKIHDKIHILKEFGYVEQSLFIYEKDLKPDLNAALKNIFGSYFECEFKD